MDKQFFTGQITKSNSDEFDGTFILSTEDVDRDGDVILADGWKLANFRKNPIALWQHDHKQPVGVWHNIRVEGKRLIADLKVASTNLGQMAKTLIEEGILKAVSVGFSFEHKDVEPRDETDPGRGFLFKRAELLETSLVSVGANPYALRIGKSLNLSNNEIHIVTGIYPESESEGKSADPALMARAKAAGSSHSGR